MADSPQVAFRNCDLEVHHPPSWKEVVNQHDYVAPTPLQPVSPNIFGFTRRKFWFMIVLAIVVMAVVVGGSVGGSLAVQNKSKPEVFKTTSVSRPPRETATLNTSMSSVAQIASSVSPSTTVPSSSNSTSFPINFYHCTQESNMVLIGDITGTMAFSLQQCIDACTVVEAPRCSAVVLGKAVAKAYRKNYGANCWLKSMLGPVQPYSDSTLRGC
ncbi:hypothetical protein B0J11DRAFT_535738 [Dendryphion nanum]|uniref:Apple domain-containing protein n=1 Tax=Dendryphion nanum TaxID=256645 RepID=A0A9P9DHD5_9PLEO|nr:hypothetical protein B0J11DRAFT_535738 [Dendryphion nanum]